MKKFITTLSLAVATAGLVPLAASAAHAAPGSTVAAAAKTCGKDAYTIRAVSGPKGKWRVSNGCGGRSSSPTRAGKITVSFKTNIAGKSQRICLQVQHDVLDKNGYAKRDKKGKQVRVWSKSVCGNSGKVTVPFPRNSMGWYPVRATRQNGSTKVGVGYVWKY